MDVVLIGGVREQLQEISFLRERYGTGIGLIEAKIIVDMIKASQSRNCDDSLLRYKMLNDLTKDALKKAQANKARC